MDVGVEVNVIIILESFDNLRKIHVNCIMFSCKR
jgi:hypothetical protein